MCCFASKCLIRAFKVPLMYLYDDRGDVGLVTLVEAYNTRRDNTFYYIDPITKKGAFLSLLSSILIA